MKFDDYSQIEIEIGKDSGKPGRTNPKPPVPPAEPVPPVSEPVPPVSEPVPPVSEPVPPVSEPVPPAAEPQPPYDPFGGQQPPYDPYGGQQPPYDPYGGQQPPYDPYGGQQPPYDPYGGQQPPYDPYGGQRPPYDPYGGQQPPYDPYGGQLKRKKEKKPPVILICVIALVVLAAVVFGVMWAVNGGFGNMFSGDGASNMVTPPAAPSASAVTPPVMQTADPHAVPTAMPTEAPDSEDPQAAEPTPSPTPSAPVNRQVVEVTASGSTGTLVMTQWQDGQWVELMRSAVYLGRNGISQNKVEGDGCTPAGTFDILFYLSTAQYDSKLDFVQVKSGDIWIVDSDSASYNTLQNENNYGDWNPREVEHIYNMFANGMTSARIMFSYNGDGINSGTADRSGGSAIFIDGTASSGELTRGYGDILMTAEEIALLLSYLDSSMDPILVVK